MEAGVPPPRTVRRDAPTRVLEAIDEEIVRAEFTEADYQSNLR
jgi:hypothetical protein